MPTKRRLLLFFIVLAVMLLIKRAVGQEGSVGWSPEAVSGGNSAGYMPFLMGLSVFGGMLFGGLRAIMRSNDARHGNYFTGDLTLLNL